MPAFFSPVTAPASWTFAVSDLTVPAGLRYAGYVLRGVRAVPPAAPSSIAMPAFGALRRVDDGGRAFVQVEVVSFPVRGLAAALPWGSPTFYLAVESPGMFAFAEHDAMLGGAPLHAAAPVTIALAVQDRQVLDPATWARQIATAITAAGGDPAPWEPFAAALEAQVSPAARMPVMLLDHASRPRTSGEVDLVYPTQTHRVALDPADGGDLQAAVRRIGATATPLPFTDVFAPAPEFTLRPVAAAGGDVQLAALEDGLTASGEIRVTRTRRHVAYTDLTSWFAPQFASTAPATSRLERYTRGNRVRPFVNGPEFYHDLFRALHDARGPGDGLLLTGWSMVHDQDLTARTPSDPAGMSTSLLAAADALAGGKFSLLPAQHYQLEDDGALQLEIALLVVVLTAIAIIAEGAQVDGLRSDGFGTVVLMAVLAFAPLGLDEFFLTGGRPIEINKPVVDGLAGKPGVTCVFSTHPSTKDDNPAAVHSGFVTQVYSATTHFGVHHQKLAVVKAGTTHIGYCGGIDLNTDRLDDTRHLAVAPYHDVHARIDGPAVRDLARTFADRWARDVPGTAIAFPPPAAGAPVGTDVVQVARTYHSSAVAARRFTFAPDGDRTIHDSLVAGLDAAQEYVYIEDQYFTPSTEYTAALLAAAARVKCLVVVLPANPDQPFGEVRRTGVIDALRAIGPHVHVGYPRLRPRLPENELRAASGRCLVMEPIEAGDTVVEIGPFERVPAPPFWLAVEGELMYVTAIESAAVAAADAFRVRVLRGPQTRLFGAAPPSGPSARRHGLGAAATVVHLPDVYVHAKLMIVDDVFLGVGSANVNRRGHFHDGEANVFTMPEGLRAGRDNPVADLRIRLWAEMLDIPTATAAGLLRDPAAAYALFGRAPLLGNRLVPYDARPTELMLGVPTGDGVVGTVLGALGFTLVATDQTDLFTSVVDPTSAVEGP